MEPTNIPLPVKPTISIDRDELLSRREMGLFSRNIDYIAMIIELEFPGRLSAQLNPKHIADRWTTEKKPLTYADVLVAVGQLAKKGLIDIPHIQFGVIVTEPEQNEPSEMN